MKWRGRRMSTNVEDRRGRGPGGTMMRRGAPIGCGGIIVLLVLTYLLGGDPQQVVEIIEQTQTQPKARTGSRPGIPADPGAPPADTLGQFASVVLADTEETWRELFPRLAGGSPYQEPTLVLFSDAVRSACGMNSAAVGPFYCPADRQVYIDLSFFGQLERQFGAPGDFAQAYVLAHEVGHHVQNLLGISDVVQRRRRQVSREEGNQLSVRAELMADCLAGVWAYHAHHSRQLLEPGDVEEGLRAAAAIGDDTIQRRSAGYTRPESWTHGSSEQRVAWLRRGMESGDPDRCDTFGG